MSSAHRPTWDPAKGRADERHKTQRVSSRDLPAHTKLKFRQPPQLLDKGQGEAGNASLPEAVAKASTASSSLDSSDDSEVEVEERTDDDEDDDDDDDDEDEDETAALMRELEKIKRERAEEKERREKERVEVDQKTREEEIAYGNPLLNLENALKGKHAQAKKADAVGRSATGYGVKRRWDDDAIFKNQAAGSGDGAEQGFVNDLTRSEFHKKFMQRYIR